MIEAARRHDPWAFTRLYQSLAPAVDAHLRAQGVREAEDVTSHVFLAVLSGCSSLHGDEKQLRR